MFNEYIIYVVAHYLPTSRAPITFEKHCIICHLAWLS